MVRLEEIKNIRLPALLESFYGENRKELSAMTAEASKMIKRAGGSEEMAKLMLFVREELASITSGQQPPLIDIFRIADTLGLRRAEGSGYGSEQIASFIYDIHRQRLASGHPGAALRETSDYVLRVIDEFNITSSDHLLQVLGMSRLVQPEIDTKGVATNTAAGSVQD